MAADPKALVQPYQNVSQVSFQFWAKPTLQNGDGTYYCPGFEGPTYASNDWDKVFIGVPYNPPLEQPYTPGICTVDCKKYRDVDKKKSAGKDGARITIHGLEPAIIEIRVMVWTPEQLRRLATLWQTIFPVAQKGSPAAYDVSHPVFSVHDVKAIQFTYGDGPTIDNQRRGTFVIHAVEFLQTGKKNITKTEVKALGSLFDPQTSNHPTPGSIEKNVGPT